MIHVSLLIVVDDAKEKNNQGDHLFFCKNISLEKGEDTRSVICIVFNLLFSLKEFFLPDIQWLYSFQIFDEINQKKDQD